MNNWTYLVITADVKNDWETLLGGNSTHCRIQRQLSDGNSHAICTEITQSQNPLSIRHDNGLQMSTNIPTEQTYFLCIFKLSHMC